MKIVIPGGTGQVGAILNRALTAAGHEVVVLTRRPRREREIAWDGRSLGPWAAELDGSDVVINLAGRSVSCRYTQANLKAMMDSRVRSTEVVGEAVASAARPPRIWLQMSTATVYTHRFDASNDEITGVVGGEEPGVPDYWAYSVEIARNWERAQERADTPHTRKVALRSAMVMSPDRDGVFDVLSRLARLGLGGPVAGGAQYVSWIHDRDFVRAVEFLIDHEELTGPVNLAAPTPVPQRAFMRALRSAWGVPVGLPATKWMAKIGALALRSDTELLLKSRRVVPRRLLDAGFVFDHAAWPEAAADLVRRARGRSGAHDRRLAPTGSGSLRRRA
ncbi:NAD-dependent epimerase/dehydratase [Streptomyces lincolnensis]|uniref:NAD-dependent epimerase/dehydratase n=1 Tax=Streptomyces lincolnensis TaxID=1915 RepID=A0A1B1M4N2_STRLN|nr:TIGR01777 family oxidoreductase [Streptomyces lincolnensis]ANS63373.1 NAD-dependent epimerase/dehydratase [Streptomyces lincolnensis]AXG52295.1 NAD-dependent epimerase/dehydratase [Streptomyces lincolnensis]QMV05267.1 TIGR01777 family protein [Streptomyces lincolnensis]